MNKMEKKVINILTIDGGGVRGLVPLYLLKYLEEDLVKLTGKTIVETFDFYGGTSIGSIIISALLYTEYKTIQEIIDNLFTDDNLIKIFSDKNILGSLGLRPRYKSDNKKNIINNVLGHKKLSECGPKDCIFTVYSIDEQKPKFIKSYRDYSSGTNVSDIVNASSSAPIYFEPFQYTISDPVKNVTTKHYGLDGAIFANNPTDYVYAEALSKYGHKNNNNLENDTEFRIISLGTGDHSLPKLGPETLNWGLIQWAYDIFNITFDTNQDIVHNKVKEFSKALGHKYVRVQEPLEISLDDITKLEFLKEIGRLWYEKSKYEILGALIKQENSSV